MAIRVPSILTDILVAIRNKLVTDGLFTPSTCFLSLTPDILKAPPNDQLCVLTPTEFRVDQPCVVGGGNDLMFWLGEFMVTLWVRLATDRQMQDTLWITDRTLGALKLHDKLFESLQLYDPTNPAGNFYMGEPMRLLRVNTGLKTNLPGWGMITSHWELHFTQNLTI